MAQYQLTLGDVARRIAENNKNIGGGFIEHNDEQYTLRGTGRVSSTSDLEDIVLLSSRGSSLLLRDVATVSIGPMPAHGAVLRNGETVSGMVIMLKAKTAKVLFSSTILTLFLLPLLYDWAEPVLTTAAF